VKLHFQIAMADNDSDQESDEEGDMLQFFSQVSQFIQV
jgi:hypothetical protein